MGLLLVHDSTANGVAGCRTIATEVLMDKNPRTDLAEKAFQLLVVGIPLVTAIIELISKVVNYNGSTISEFRLHI
jgi:phage-related minor tail protein